MSIYYQSQLPNAQIKSAHQHAVARIKLYKKKKPALRARNSSESRKLTESFDPIARPISAFESIGACPLRSARENNRRLEQNNNPQYQRVGNANLTIGIQCHHCCRRQRTTAEGTHAAGNR